MAALAEMTNPLDLSVFEDHSHLRFRPPSSPSSSSSSSSSSQRNLDYLRAVWMPRRVLLLRVLLRSLSSEDTLLAAAVQQLQLLCAPEPEHDPTPAAALVAEEGAP